MFPKTKVPKIFRNTNFRPESPRKFHNSPNKSLILQISQFQHARAPCPQVRPQVFRAWVRSPQFRYQLFDWGIELILNSSWLHGNYVIACGSRYFCYTKDHFETKILMMNAFWRFDRLVPSFPTTRAKLPGIESFDHTAISVTRFGKLIYFW